METEFSEEGKEEIRKLAREVINKGGIEDFEDVLGDVGEAYIKNMKDKKKSWKTLPLDFLQKKLTEELDEFDTSKHSYNELIDVILISLMLAKRLKEEENL